LTADDPLNQSGSYVALIVANAEVGGCSDAELPISTFGIAQPTEGASDAPPVTNSGGPIADRLLACLVGKPMAPGSIRVVVSQGIPQIVGVGPVESFDPQDWGGMVPGESYTGGLLVPDKAMGWTHLIDGMPAKLVVTPGPTAVGAAETRTWAVAQPGRLDAPWLIRATFRGPDLDALRLQADTVAQSLRFDEKPPPLDEARRDAALARAIDDVDRQFRQYPGSALFGCFPRTAGEREVELTDGPGGPLLNPVAATCRTTVEATPLLLWHATLVVAWSAGNGDAAGQWGHELYFGAEGPAVASGTLFDSNQVPFPGAGRVPPPLTEPLVIPIGSVVQLLPPGLDQAGPAYQAIYQRPNDTIAMNVATDAQPGRRFSIVAGPVTHEGTNWYLADLSQGSLYPGYFAWLPATDSGRPLLRIVEPACPTGEVSVADLLALIPAERLRCFGNREVTLDPVTASLAEDQFEPAVDGTPAWLARDTRWRLFGDGGPDAVNGSLAVALSPTVGETLPLNVWLAVRGHFDDAAAATCTRTNPQDWGLPNEPPAIQTLRCRHLFVVTSLERRDAP